MGPAQANSNGGENNMPTKFEEYKQLAALEIESTKVRLTTFTTIISVSFLLPGLALRPEAEAHLVTIPGVSTITLSRAVFLLGFFFYLFAVFHYAWHHRYSHRYRKKLKVLEEQLGIEAYRLRVRPKVGRMKLHFDWALQMIGIIYAAITAIYVGLRPFVAALAVVVVAYVVRMILSAFQTDEPLET